jgi:hypothetical protein
MNRGFKLLYVLFNLPPPATNTRTRTQIYKRLDSIDGGLDLRSTTDTKADKYPGPEQICLPTRISESSLDYATIETGILKALSIL